MPAKAAAKKAAAPAEKISRAGRGKAARAGDAKSSAAPGGDAAEPSPIVSLLPYQEEAFDCASRELFLLWGRQRGKSHVFGAKALQRMARFKNHSVFLVNASLLMGQENILKEAAVWGALMDHARLTMEAQGKRLTTSADDDKGRLLDVDALADMFEKSKLEARLWWSRTTYSRSRVVAPNPLTARGFTGDVFGDEVGFWPDFEAVFDAVEPIISRSPRFLLWMATTPPMDSDHPVFSLLMPKREEWEVNPRGNWFRTDDGAPVHRVDVRDGEAAGLPLFDRSTKAPISWEAARAKARNKASFDRNYLLRFVEGGSAAIPRHLLLNALARDSGGAFDLGVISEEEGME